MFKDIRDSFMRAAESISRGAEALSDIRQMMLDNPSRSGWSEDFVQRVEAIERTIHSALAEAEASEMRAESRFKTARSAEERARAKEASLAKAQQGDEEGEGSDVDEEALREYLAELQQGDGEGGNPDGVQPVPSLLEARRTRRQQLIRAKWNAG